MCTDQHVRLFSQMQKSRFSHDVAHSDSPARESKKAGSVIIFSSFNRDRQAADKHQAFITVYLH